MTPAEAQKEFDAYMTKCHQESDEMGLPFREYMSMQLTKIADEIEGGVRESKLKEIFQKNHENRI